jgi:hypothetical protein
MTVREQAEYRARYLRPYHEAHEDNPVQTSFVIFWFLRSS